MTTHRATLIFLISTFLWGLTFVFIKNAVAEISPYAFIFYRFILGAFCLLVFFPKSILDINLDLVSKAIVLAFILAGTVIFQTIGLKNVNASTASFITGTAVIYVVFLSAVSNKKIPSSLTLLGSCLSIIGLALVTIYNKSVALSIDCIWIVLCSMCFGLYFFISKTYIKNVNIICLTYLQFFLIAVIALLIAIFKGYSLSISISSNSLIAILYCGIFASSIAFYLQLKSQTFLSTQKTSMLFTMEPVFATIASIIVLHEKLTPCFYLGALLIVLSILIIRE